MPDVRKDTNPEIVVNHAHGTQIDHAASRISVRDFDPLIADEKVSGGGQNRGPSPLEYILVGLCA